MDQIVLNPIIGRRQEVNIFKNWLEDSADPFILVYYYTDPSGLYKKGGVGKTLLRQARNEYKSHLSFCSSNLPPTISVNEEQLQKAIEISQTQRLSIYVCPEESNGLRRVINEIGREDSSNHTDSRHPRHIFAVSVGRCVLLSCQVDGLVSF